MTRRFKTTSVALAAMAMAALSTLSLAHEGHGKGEIAPYDLDTPRQVSPETAAHIGLETAEIDFGDVEETLRLVGVVRAVPDRRRAIATRITGSVRTIVVQVGDTVQKGELLAEIDSPQLAQAIYEARKLDSEYYALLVELAQAQSKIAELRVQSDTALKHSKIVDAEYTRLQENNGAVAVNMLSGKEAEALRYRSEVKLRALELKLAQRQSDSMGLQAEAMRRSKDALRDYINEIRGETTDFASDALGLIHFYAPMNGVVIARNVNTGQGVDSGVTLLEIADYSSVQIEGELPESLVDRLGGASGKQVRIRRDSDYDGEVVGVGAVRFVSPVIDPIKRTTHVLIQAENPNGVLRDGQYVDLSIVLRLAASAVVVPKSAVVTDGPMHFVFIKDGELYKKQDINPGFQDDLVVEVLGGLVPGDIVVTQGAYSLTQLRPKPAAAAGVASASQASPETDVKKSTTSG